MNMVCTVEYAFTVKIDAPWKTIEEALAFAKVNPMKMRISNSGPGAIWHVAAALLGSKAGVQCTHVPYGGANPAALALAGGHVEATTASPAEVGTLVKGGKLRILAIASDKRDPLFPDVPTFKERGIDLVFRVWRCLVAPTNTPREIIARLEKAEKAKDEGLKIILEIIEQVKEIPGVHGIHIMAVGWEDIVPEIVDRAGFMPRPNL